MFLLSFLILALMALGQNNICFNEVASSPSAFKGVGGLLFLGLEGDVLAWGSMYGGESS